MDPPHGLNHRFLHDVGMDFHEWKGSSKKTYTLIVLGILTLILSTIIIGYGTYLKGATGGGH